MDSEVVNEETMEFEVTNEETMEFEQQLSQLGLNIEDFQDDLNCAIDVSRLIENVRQNPPLWFLASAKYNKKPIKESIYLKFEKEMGVEASLLEEKWTNLKKCYGREKTLRRKELSKSGEPGPAKKSKRKGFPHFEAMKFLDLNDKVKKNFSNVRRRGSRGWSRSAANSSARNSGALRITAVSSCSNTQESVASTSSNSQIACGSANDSSTDFEDSMSVFELIDQNQAQSLAHRSSAYNNNSKTNESSILVDSGIDFSTIDIDASTSTVSEKENSQPGPSSTLSSSPWFLHNKPKTTPKHCFTSVSNKKVDPLVNSVQFLSDAVVTHLKSDEKKIEKNRLPGVPPEDILFGETVAAELSKIQDLAVKQQKKASIMMTIFSPTPTL